MDLDKAITVTKINIQDDSCCYLMIGWQSDCFEMYLYIKDKIWKGRFSPNRLAGFSKNLHMSKDEYYASLKDCLSQQKDEYHYELNSGFFYWKRKSNGSVVIEGFLPMEEDTSPKNLQPDLVEILVALNKYLKEKITDLKYKFETIKTDYNKCLKDTKEFLDLKIEMEKALSDKLLDLLCLKKTKIHELHSLQLNSKQNTIL